MDKEQGLLKRCPFCGGEAHLQENGATGNRYWEVACYEPCDFCGPSHDTREEAIVAWNRRSSSDEQRAEVVTKPAHYRDAPADLKDKAREIVVTFGAGDGNNALMEGAICAALVDERWLASPSPAVATGGVTEEMVRAAMAAYTNEPSNDMRDMMRAAISAADAWTRANPVTQSASCPGCRGTGDQGGNPSYGVCDDCDGSGTVQVPTPPSRGEGE